MTADNTVHAFDSCTFIINPVRLPEYAKILKKILKRISVPCLVESKSKDHFIESVREFCRSDFRHLLVWGGDGTAHDAINTVTEEMTRNPEIRTKKALGFLRGGSGNGIQDSYEVPFGIKKQVLTYADSMSNNYAIDVDLLKITYGEHISYCQLVGFGFDSFVLKRRSERVYRFGARKGQIRKGMTNYLISGLRTFVVDFEEMITDLSLDLHHGKYAFRGTRVNAELPFEQMERAAKAIEVEIGSRPFYGHLFKICPDVVCNDGYLDVYIYNLKGRWAILQNALWLWMGNHDRINRRFAKGNKPLIERYEVKSVDISSDKPIDFHIDGDLVSMTEKKGSTYRINIEVLPQQISFLVPGTFYRKFYPFES